MATSTDISWVKLDGDEVRPLNEEDDTVEIWIELKGMQPHYSRYSPAKLFNRFKHKLMDPKSLPEMELMKQMEHLMNNGTVCEYKLTERSLDLKIALNRLSESQLHYRVEILELPTCVKPDLTRCAVVDSGECGILVLKLHKQQSSEQWMDMFRRQGSLDKSS